MLVALRNERWRRMIYARPLTDDEGAELQRMARRGVTNVLTETNALAAPTGAPIQSDSA